MFDLLPFAQHYNAGGDNKVMILWSEEDSHDTGDSLNIPELQHAK